MKEIKQKIFKSIYQNGFLDISVGAILVFTSLNQLLHVNFWFFLFEIIFIGFILRLGKNFTESRMGRVELLEKSSKSKNLMYLLSMMLFTILLTLMIISVMIIQSKGSISNIYFELIGMFFVIGTLGLLAYSIHLVRMYYYSMMIGVVFIITILIDIYLGSFYVTLSVLSLIMGFFIGSIGIYYLIQFIKHYPSSKGD